MIQSAHFWLVLLVTALLYWQVPERLRRGFLAAVSFAYLAVLAPTSLCVLLVWVAAFYGLLRAGGPEAPGRRSVSLLLIVGVLGQLAYFKYLPPLIGALSTNEIEAQVVVPLGMSFFTFKLVHYALEVSRGNVDKGSFQDFCCYMFLFPIFTAGPIERFDNFLTNQESRWSLSDTVEGLTRIVHGVIKKFFLADVVVREILMGSANDGNLTKWLGAAPYHQLWWFLILYFVYIYLDFSAYSDIGIGASRLFGLRIMENFHFPLVATNISDFWKRWHISLSRWCQAYVYLPTIGLTRNPYLATIATFLVMGLWHAGTLNRIGWGLYHATGIAVFITWTQFKRRTPLRRLDRTPLRYAGLPITLLFLAGSAAFLVVEQPRHGVYDAVRILGRLVFLELPAA